MVKKKGIDKGSYRGKFEFRRTERKPVQVDLSRVSRELEKEKRKFLR